MSTQGLASACIVVALLATGCLEAPPAQPPPRVFEVPLEPYQPKPPSCGALELALDPNPAPQGANVTIHVLMRGCAERDLVLLGGCETPEGFLVMLAPTDSSNETWHLGNASVTRTPPACAEPFPSWPLARNQTLQTSLTWDGHLPSGECARMPCATVASPGTYRISALATGVDAFWRTEATLTLYASTADATN